MSKLESALALAKKGFWVFPLKVNGKTPAHTGWQDEATRDPVAIRAMWANDAAYNVGIFTSRFEDDKALVVIDVDNKNGKDGDAELFKLDLAGRDTPATLEQRTPTGGRHLVYRAAQPVKQGANVLAPGLDIRSRGGYCVGDGSVLPVGPYSANGNDVALAPQWLVDACGRSPDRAGRVPAVSAGAIDAGRAGKRAIDYLTKRAPVSAEGQGGDETAYKVACKVKDLGVDQITAEALMLEHWNDRCLPPWDGEDLAEKVANAYAYGTEPIGASAPEAQFPPVVADKAKPKALHPLAALNDRYAFIRVGTAHMMLEETTDEEGRAVVQFVKEGSFHAQHAMKKFTVGKREEPLTKVWMEWDKRRTYERLIFMPEKKCDPRFFNLWRGFDVVPAATGSDKALAAVAAWEEHLLENVCGGDTTLANWLTGWCAHMVQRPWEKPLTSVVFKGKKGVGKNSIIERVGALFENHTFVAGNGRYLTGQFNSHLEQCLLLVLDEACWGGDKQAEGILKDLITGKHHNIERKGVDVYKARNLTRAVVIGNEGWLVPASEDERRFAVFNVTEGRRQDRRFFHDMRVGMEEGGYAILLHRLQTFDLTSMDVNAAPETTGLLEQKVASLQPLDEWWLDCLTEGRIAAGDFGDEWPGTVSKESVRQAFGRYLKDRNIRSRAPDSRAIGKTLLRLCPPLLAKNARINNVQTNVYVFPPMDEARAAWDKHIGHAGVW